MNIRVCSYRVFTVLLLMSFAIALTPQLACGTDEYASTASILEIGVGARSLAMGGAGIGLADDASAIFYNPAGLARLDGAGINSTHMEQFNALPYNSVSAAVDRFGIAGMSISSGPFEAVDEYGLSTGGTLTYSSSAWMAGFGVTAEELGLGKTGSGLGLGIKAEGYNSTLSETTGSGLNLVLAAQLTSKVSEGGSIRIGGVVGNMLVGKPLKPFIPSLGVIKYSDGDGDVVHKEVFPTTLGIGLGYKKRIDRDKFLNIALDWRGSGGVRGGIETWLGPLAVRIGARSSGMITLGGGVKLASLGVGNMFENLQIDGALVRHEDLDDFFLLSASLQV